MSDFYIDYFAKCHLLNLKILVFLEVVYVSVRAVPL